MEQASRVGCEIKPLTCTIQSCKHQNVTGAVSSSHVTADFVGPLALRSTCTWRYFIPTCRQPIRLLRISEPTSKSPDGAGVRDIAFALDL
jgi:hypothetical protein